MPPGNPQVYEVWSTTVNGQAIHGVISRVTPTVISLVSFTGNRFHAAPSRFGWTFVSNAPVTTRSCDVDRCTEMAVFFGALHGVDSRNFLCPQHMPIGVTAAHIDTLSQRAEFIPTETIEIPTCLACDRVSLTYNASSEHYTCEACNAIFYRCIYEDHRSTLHRLRRDAQISSPTRIHTGAWSLHVSPHNHIRLLQEYQGDSFVTRTSFNDVSIVVKRIPDSHIYFQTRAGAMPAPRSIDESDVAINQRWVNRVSGVLIEITGIRTAPNPDHSLITFRETNGSPTVTLAWEDFKQNFRPLDQREPAKTESHPDLDLVPGDEYWSATSYLGPNIIIVGYNKAQGVVTVTRGNGELTQIRAIEFSRRMWEKVVRATVFDRLLGDDDICG